MEILHTDHPDIEVHIQEDTIHKTKTLSIRHKEREIGAYRIEAWVEPKVGVLRQTEGIQIDITSI